MTNDNLKILNAIPLTDVMRGWGFSPISQSLDGKTARYTCPWHDDHHPSLLVDKVVREKATDLGFKCWASHCGQEGYGAIQLAARLMGFPAGAVPDEDMQSVLAELITRCDVKLKEEETDGRHYNTLRVSVVGWDKFHEQEEQYADWKGDTCIFERGEWTEEGLKALGLKVELVTRRAKAGDASEEVRTGDLVTEFDKGTNEPLFRCSLGSGFYSDPKKAEARTVREWGTELERVFNVEPVARFIQKVPTEKGGSVVRIVRATRNYPIFRFHYDFADKKYEPRDIFGKNKWTWFNVGEDADLYHRWYADVALKDYLEHGVIPQQDERHPIVEKKDKDEKPEKPRFKRVVICSGPRDAIAVYSHSDAHVLWLHSEQAGFDNKGGSVRPNRWLRSLLRKLQNVTEEDGLYVCYDEDDAGLAASQAIALNSPNIHWLRLPSELQQITVDKQGKHLKDVTDFVTRFAEVERLMPADLRHDDPCEWFENALFDTPSTKFWQWESERKDADGTGRARYKFDLRNTPVFLRARGMVRKVMQGEDEVFSRFFIVGNDKMYTECFTGLRGGNRLVTIARDLMAEWLRAHKEYNDKKGALSRAIYSAKLEQSSMETIETLDIDDKSYGEDFDYFFFENTAVKVTKDGWEPVPYNRMKWMTNTDAVLKGNFTVQQQPWRVVVNPYYQDELIKHEDILSNVKTAEEREQENMRFDAITNVWKYKLVMDKPLEEMPLHFRFLYNVSRIFWEKEADGAELTKTEKQMQDMYFITMLHAIGSALVRHRSANRQQFIHITDNGTRREYLASGGTGKTAILDLLSVMRRVLSIDGKALEGSNIVLEQELGKIVPGIHNVVCIDELPAGFSPKKMYNLPLSVTSRGMYKGSVVLRGDDIPKFVVASNEQLDMSSDSTSRRIYQVLVSDWYHPRSVDGSRPAHTPADDFFSQYGIKEIARNLPPSILNEARNFLLGCVQLFFQYPDETLCPPRDSRAMLRQALAASKDEQFTLWISGYLADKRHIGIPIAQQELCISFLDYCGITVAAKTIKAARTRIRNNLDEYIRTSIYKVNPVVVLRTPTDREKGFRRCAAWQYELNPDGSIKTDANGNRLPRVLDKTNQQRVYYFYKKGRIPRNFYDDSGAHIGDPDYVQGPPEKDPEADNDN